MHQSFVTMPPPPDLGDSHANVLCFYFSIVPAVCVGGGGGNARNLCYIGKNGSAM